MKARERGAKIIHVDPHFSRTSASADLYVPIRAGTDIAFLGGLIHHILETESYFRDYVVNYTNASMILREDFRDAEDLGGLFSGFDPETGVYDRTTWMFEGGDPDAPASDAHHATQAFTEKTAGHADAPRDPTLEHPRCVFQVLKRHYARYTPEMVERICGTPKELFARGRRDADRQLGPRAHDDARLRRRLDAALGRRADHPRRHDRADAARQRRASRRRDHGDARARVDPGLDRHPDALRDPPRLPADAARAGGGSDARGVCRGQRPQEGLVVALRRVHRLVAEGLVRRRGHAGERLRLRAPAEADRQPLALPDDAARARRRARRPVRDGPEPGRRLDPLRAAAARAGRSALARRARPDRARDGPLLAGLAGDPLGRAAHRGHRDRGVPDAVRRPRREGRALHEHAAAAAVARQGDRPAGRRALGAALHGPPRAPAEGPLRGLRARARLADPPPHLGLLASRARCRSPIPRRSCARSRGSRSPAGARSTASPSSRPTAAPRAAAGSTRAASPAASTRRAGATPATSRRPAAGCRRTGAGRGPRTGGSSTTARPPIRRAGRGRSASASSGGTRPRATGPATTCRTSRPACGPTTGRTTTPRAWTRSPATPRSS